MKVASPNLEGARTTMTSVNGDYLFRSLPPGDYTVAFSLDGFTTREVAVKLTAAQSKTIDAVLYPDTIRGEELVITGALETISSSSQAATTCESNLMEKPPIPRDVANAVALAPGVHTTGPSDNISISGSQSHESLFLIDGVVVNQNLRGQPTSPFIEDAIQETTTSTSGISAEYGRFAGGVVNVLTKSGGNELSGSFRVNLDNEDWLAKASYFLSTDTLGSHDLVFGYDHFADKQLVMNHQSGSDWIFSASEFVFAGQDWAPVVYGDGSADFDWFPILAQDQGSEFAVDSAFVNDTWRLNENWSFNVGLRYDKNDGKNSIGATVSDDSKISPRVGVSWDPGGDGEWILNFAYANYATILANTGNVGNQSPGGNPATFIWLYDGPEINVGCTPGVDCVAPAQVIQQVFNYFENSYCNADGQCGVDNFDSLVFVDVPGLNRVIQGSLSSPYSEEWTIGATKRLVTQGIFRADYVWRAFKDLYETRVDLATGTVALEALGVNWGEVDLGFIQNSTYLERTYHGVTLSAQYRVTDRLNLGGNYTWSQAYGNFDGETSGSGPVTSQNNPGYYPEYRDVRWSNPNGPLGVDQRHKARAWLTWDIVSSRRQSLTFSWLESFFSGTPYQALGTVRSRLYVDNPGYSTLPSNAACYSTPRGAFTTDSVHRTDISLYYSSFLPIAGADLELFVQPEITNLLNEDAVVKPNTTVLDFHNGYDDFDASTETPLRTPPGPASVTGPRVRRSAEQPAPPTSRTRGSSGSRSACASDLRPSEIPTWPRGASPRGHPSPGSTESRVPGDATRTVRPSLTAVTSGARRR